MGLKVINRKGEREDVRFDAILEKLTILSKGLNSDWVDPGMISKLVIEGLYDGVTTRELDGLAAETAASLVSHHSDYSLLAARIAIDDLHRSTKNCFSELVRDLYEYIDPESEKSAPLISDEVHKIVMENAKELDSYIDYNRDNNYDYFGFKTLERSYLLKLDGEVAAVRGVGPDAGRRMPPTDAAPVWMSLCMRRSCQDRRRRGLDFP